MTILNQGDLVQVIPVCQLAPQIGINVRHYLVDYSVGSDVEDSEIVGAVSAAFAGALGPMLNNSAQYYGTSMQIVSPVVAPAVSSRSGTAFGTGGVDPLPTQTCGVVTLQTAGIGRFRRGRAYAPFPAEDANTTGFTPVPAYVAFLAVLGGLFTQIAGLTGALGTVTLNGVVWSRHSLVNPPNTYPITQVRANTKWGTQRRRGAYGASNNPPF